MGASQVPWSCEAEALLTLPRNTAGAALRAQTMLIRLQPGCIDPSGLPRVGSGPNPRQRHHAERRCRASRHRLVMLEGIALVAIVTSAITSTFVARATHPQDVAAAKNLEKEESACRLGSTISRGASTAARRRSALSASADALGWMRVPGVGKLE